MWMDIDIEIWISSIDQVEYFNYGEGRKDPREALDENELWKT